jgi:hypothetical protein
VLVILVISVLLVLRVVLYLWDKTIRGSSALQAALARELFAEVASRMG